MIGLLTEFGIDYFFECALLFVRFKCELTLYKLQVRLVVHLHSRCNKSFQVHWQPIIDIDTVDSVL